MKYRVLFLNKEKIKINTKSTTGVKMTKKKKNTDLGGQV